MVDGNEAAVVPEGMVCLEAEGGPVAGSLFCRKVDRKPVGRRVSVGGALGSNLGAQIRVIVAALFPQVHLLITNELHAAVEGHQLP